MNLSLFFQHIMQALPRTPHWLEHPLLSPKRECLSTKRESRQAFVNVMASIHLKLSETLQSFKIALQEDI